MRVSRESPAERRMPSNGSSDVAPGDAAEVHRELLQRAVAGLSNRAIREMSAAQLIFAICTARLAAPAQVDQRRLEFADRSTLERLAFLARRACRHGNGCAPRNGSLLETAHQPRDREAKRAMRKCFGQAASAR